MKREIRLYISRLLTNKKGESVLSMGYRVLLHVQSCGDILLYLRAMLYYIGPRYIILAYHCVKLYLILVW